MKRLQKHSLLLVVMLLLAVGVMGQMSVPRPQTLPFSFGAIDTTDCASATPCAFPEWVVVHQQRLTAGYEPAGTDDTFVEAPVVDTLDASNDAWHINNTGSGVGAGGWDRFGDNGISLIAHANNGQRRVRGIVTAINTKGKSNIKVSWKFTLINSMNRHNNAMALQYKVGELGDGTAFVNVPNTNFNYRLVAEQGTAGSDSSYTYILPAELEDKDSVYIRWVYWMSYKGSGGAREKLGLSDVVINETAASFEDGYPQNGEVNKTDATILFKTDLPTTLYYVLSTSATKPSVSDIESGGETLSLSNVESSKKFESLTEGTTYYLHYIFKHGDLTSDEVSTHQYTTEASSLSFSAGYPVLSDTTYNSIKIKAMTSMASTLYYLVSETNQSIADINALKAAGGVASLEIATPGTEVDKDTVGLKANQEYYVYCAAESGANSTAVVELTFKTKRNLVSFVDAYPSLGSASRDGFKLLVKTDKEATIYYVTSTTEQNYVDANALIAAAEGNQNVMANVEDTITITGKNALTLYYTYMVAKNSDGEVTDIKDLQVTTTSNAPAFLEYSIINITSTSFDLKVIADKNATMHFVVQEQAYNYTAEEILASPNKQTETLTAGTELIIPFAGSQERRYYIYAFLAEGTDYSEVKRAVKAGDLFNVEGALSVASNRSGTPRTVETVVPQFYDVSNIPDDKIIYSIPDSSIWWDADGGVPSPLPNDYSDRVVRSVRDTVRDSTLNSYAITVRNLLPADNLPLAINFSNSNPSQWDKTTKGWAGAGQATAQSTVFRMGSHPSTFLIAFSDVADSIAYELTTVSGNFDTPDNGVDPEFLVQGTVNGDNWVTLRHFTKDNPVPGSTTTAYKDGLGDSIRIVRFFYKVRDGRNMNVNNVVVTPKEGLPLFSTGYPKVENPSSAGIDLGFRLQTSAKVSYKFSKTPLTLTAAQLSADAEATHLNLSVDEVSNNTITSLDAKTDYYLYMVAENGGKYSALKEYRFRTLSSTPDFAAGYPQLGDIGKQVVDVKVRVEKSCTVYYLADTIEKAPGYTNADLYAEANKKSMVVPANQVQNISVTGLTPNKDYYLYFTTRDDLGEMAALEVLEATTLPADRDANIITFSIINESKPAVIDTLQGLVIVTVPEGTDLTSIIPRFTLKTANGVLKTLDGQIIVSDISMVDFTDTVYCKVVAEEPTVEKLWRIKVDIGSGGGTSVKKDELGFTLYPNPFTNELYISSDEDVEYVQLVSLQGTVVLTQYGVSIIQTSQIPNGMYILKVQSKQGKMGAKLVLKK